MVFGIFCNTIPEIGGVSLNSGHRDGFSRNIRLGSMFETEIIL